MSRVPRAAGLLALVLSTLTLSGCWDAREMNDLAISTAVGVDRMANGNVRVTEQVSLPFTSQQSTGAARTGGGQWKTSFYPVSGEGADMTAAEAEAQRKLSRKLFSGAVEIVVFGEAEAKKGIEREFDTFIRDHSSRLRVAVVISRGDATRLLNMMYPLERQPSLGARRIAYGKAKNPTLDIAALGRALSTPGEQALVPIVERVHATQKGPVTFDMAGMAVLVNGRWVDTLDPTQSDAVRWILGEVRPGGMATIDIPGQSAHLTSELVRVRAHRWIHFDKNRPRMDVDLYMEDQVVENNSNLNMGEARDLAIVDQLLTKTAETQIQSTIERLQKRDHADVIRCTDAVRRADARRWAQLVPKWEETFSSMPIHVRVKVRVERSGMITRSDTWL